MTTACSPGADMRRLATDQRMNRRKPTDLKSVGSSWIQAVAQRKTD